MARILAAYNAISATQRRSPRGYTRRHIQDL